MAYKIIFTARAKRDLEAILDDDSGRYSPAQQQDYVRAIRGEVFALNPLPKRGTKKEYNGREYRRLNYKAHAVFFRVLDDENTVMIDAVLHSHMDFDRHL